MLSIEQSETVDVRGIFSRNVVANSVIWRASIVICVSMIVADEVAALDPIRTAREYGDLLKSRRPVAEPGLGLLVVDLQLAVDDWPAGTAYEVELAPSTGGTSIREPMKVGEPGILRLDAGRYCLVAIEHAGTRYTDKCAPPFYDVSANSVDFTGTISAKVRRNRISITNRQFDFARVGQDLTEAQRTEVDSFLRDAAMKDTRTFFVSSPLGLFQITRLLPDGVAEFETYSVANASYVRGTWSADGESLDLRFYEGHSRLRLEPSGGEWRGVEENLTGANVGGVEFRTTRQLALSTRPACWHWTSCGTRFSRSVVTPPDYTFVPKAAALTGTIEFRFELRSEAGVALPHKVSVLSSTLSRAHTKAVTKNFADSIYSSDIRVPNAAAYRQTLSFRREGDSLRVDLSAIEVVPR